MKRHSLFMLSLFIPFAAAFVSCDNGYGKIGGDSLSLSVSPALIWFDAVTGAGKVITVKSSSSWTAVPDEGLEIDKASGGAGEETVTVTSMVEGGPLKIVFTTTEKSSSGKPFSKTVNVMYERTEAKPVDPQSYWYKAADSASMELLNRYWPPLLSRASPRSDVVANWHFTHTQDYKSDPNNNYWQQAHAMDVIIDAYDRTPSTPQCAQKKALWLSIFDKWFQGAPKMQWMSNENWAASKWTTAYPGVKTGSAGGWRNEFIDDMAWMVLTQIRMYESLRTEQPVLAAKYMEKAKEIYDDYIWGWAWDPVGKGVYWKRDANAQGVPQSNSKNACINGPAMIIAAKLAHYATGTEDKAKYLGQAKDIYNWMSVNLFKSSGVVADYWSNGASGGGATVYNQGTFMGGCHWLYKLTGELKYLQSAVRAADHTINSMQLVASNGTKLLDSHCSSNPNEGNNSVFRAIFLRYLVPLINEPGVNEIGSDKRIVWAENLKTWAEYVWKEGKSIDKGDGKTPGVMLFSHDWRVMHPAANIASPGVPLGNQVSGAALIEAMNMINLNYEL